MSRRPLLILLLLAGCIPGPRPEPRPALPAEQAVPVRPVDPQPLPPSPPPFEARTVAPDAIETAPSVHVVARGETLTAISDRTGASIEAIARANRIAPPYAIRAGQKLRIPGGRWHGIRAGETGIAIARAYGVEWTRIAQLNQIDEPYILRTGQRLLLPGRGEVAAMSMEERAAAFRLDIDDLITGGEPALAANAEPIKPVATTPPPAPLPPTVAVAAGRGFDGAFAWPLTGRVLLKFGPFGSGRRNDGINIAADQGAPVLAAADGVVVYAGNDIASYGGLVLIRHGERWTTAYGHASQLLVTRGQAVRRGQLIARAGESGTVDRPQLHFEIREGRKPVDPLLKLPKRI